MPGISFSDMMDHVSSPPPPTHSLPQDVKGAQFNFIMVLTRSQVARRGAPIYRGVGETGGKMHATKQQAACKAGTPHHDRRRLCGVRPPTPHPTQLKHKQEMQRRRRVGNGTTKPSHAKKPARLSFLPFIVMKTMGEAGISFMAIIHHDGTHRIPHATLSYDDTARAEALWKRRLKREQQLRLHPRLKPSTQWASRGF